jgi:hypothetical protein
MAILLLLISELSARAGYTEAGDTARSTLGSVHARKHIEPRRKCLAEVQCAQMPRRGIWHAEVKQTV